MKILQVVSSPPFAWAAGGCARVVYDLSRELVKKGHNITLLTTDLYTPQERYLIQNNPESVEGITIVRFKNISNSLAWKIKFYFAPGLIFHLRKNVQDYDIVHLQDLLSVHAIFTSYYCKKYRVPYVLTTHGSIPWLNKKNLVNRIFKTVFGKKIIRDASNVIVLNNTEYNLCNEYVTSETKIQVIPNGINPQDYAKIPENGEFKKLISIPQNDRIILYLGRLYEDKGIDLLVKSFSNLALEIPAIKLVLVGPDDGYQKTLDLLIKKLQIRDNTFIFGFASDSEKISALRDAYVIVIPKFSGFPVTFLEACMLGLPIITTNAGDELDWINGRVGYVVDYNETALTLALKAILSDKAKRNDLSNTGIHMVQQDFIWKVLVNRIEKSYQNSITTGA